MSLVVLALKPVWTSIGCLNTHPVNVSESLHVLSWSVWFFQIVHLSFLFSFCSTFQIIRTKCDVARKMHCSCLSTIKFALQMFSYFDILWPNNIYNDSRVQKVWHHIIKHSDVIYIYKKKHTSFDIVIIHIHYNTFNLYYGRNECSKQAGRIKGTSFIESITLHWCINQTVQ